MSGVVFPGDPSSDGVLHDCVATLTRVAKYHLPRPIDQRLLWLSENKESLSDTEREVDPGPWTTERVVLGGGGRAARRPLQKVSAAAASRPRSARYYALPT